MIIKLTIEFPDELGKALDLFCKVYEKKLNLIAGITTEKMSETGTDQTAEPPPDEQFARLSLPEMEMFMKNPENLSAFRFRAFAACAREVYGKSVEELSCEINEKGINGILKDKDKTGAALYISRVINKEFPEKTNDIEF